jgi:hypothetical protein
LGGCTAFHGITPIEPEVGNPCLARKVNSLQPILSWKPSERPGVTYDLIIYESIEVQDMAEPGRVVRQPGDVVYYREGLTLTEHLVEEPLKPKTYYYWSIRVRSNGDISKWSHYDYYANYCLYSVYSGNYLFPFVTSD